MITNIVNNSDLEKCEQIGKLSLPIFFNKSDLLEIVENNSSDVLVYKENNKILGFLVYINIESRKHILSLATHPNYRRKNIASSLIDYLKDNDKNDITLYVQCINQNAIKLYKKSKFKICVKIPDYYQNLNDKEAYLMMFSTKLL